MVNSASLYQIYNKKRDLINEAVVFAIKQKSKFNYEIHVINATGYTFLKQSIIPELSYDVNIDRAFLKWFKVGENKIYELNFNDKKDVALSIKFAIQ